MIYSDKGYAYEDTRMLKPTIVCVCTKSCYKIPLLLVCYLTLSLFVCYFWSRCRWSVRSVGYLVALPVILSITSHIVHVISPSYHPDHNHHMNNQRILTKQQRDEILFFGICLLRLNLTYRFIEY